MDLGNKTWFVRVDGKVRGPFNSQVIHSMKDRGRITPSSELSDDRRAWYSAYDFSDLFTEPVEVQDAIAVLSESSLDSARYYYNNQGVQTGPVTLERLQELAAMGVLIESDLVWFEGAPDWFPASQLNELTFSKQTDSAKKWVFQNKVLASIVAAALLVAIIVPTWYILNLNASRTAELREKEKVQDAGVRAAELVALRKEETTLRERLDTLSAQENVAIDAMANGGIDSRKRLGTIKKEKNKVDASLADNEEKQKAEERKKQDAEERLRLANKESNLISIIIGLAAGFMSTMLGIAYMVYRAISGRGSSNHSAEREIYDARRDIHDAKREITDALRELKK